MFKEKLFYPFYTICEPCPSTWYLRVSYSTLIYEKKKERRKEGREEGKEGGKVKGRRKIMMKEKKIKRKWKERQDRGREKREEGKQRRKPSTSYKI